MKKFYAALARLRLVLAIGVLVLFAYFYLRGAAAGETGEKIFAALLNTQLSASALRRGLAEETVLLFLIAALVVGRLFCCVFCPTGTLQEVVWRAAKPLRLRRAARFTAPWRARYALPLIAAIGVVAAIPPLMLAADPLSTFGRSFGATRLLLREGARALPPVLWASLAFFAVVLAFALLRGRRFCDWCPVGVALGCVARVAPFGVTMDRETCVACGLCERACPMNCVDARARTVDRARCVLCLSCAAACPNGSMRCGVQSRARAGMREKRRAFTVDAVKKAAGLALGLAYFGGRNARNVINAGLPARAEGPVTISRILPPGALSESNYASRCVACGACVAACPVGVVKIADSPQPRLDYSGDYCQYSCTACGAVCPTAAIRHLTPDEKRRTRVALSKLHLDRCVVVTNSQACGACAEVCPTHALVMEPYGETGSGLTIPVYDEQYCIGCGACLYACPAEPRAFTLTGLAEQTRTEGIRPDSDEEGLPPLPAPPGEDDFPF